MSLLIPCLLAFLCLALIGFGDEAAGGEGSPGGGEGGEGEGEGAAAAAPAKGEESEEIVDPGDPLYDDVTPKPGDETETPKEGEQKVEELDAGLRSRAQEVGLSEDDLKSMQPGVVEKFIALHDKKLADLGRSELEGGGEGDEGGQVAPEPKPKEKGAEEFKLELDPDLLDEKTIKTIQGMKSHYDGQMARMSQDLDAIVGHMQKAEQLRLSGEVDKMIDGLGKDWEDVFGKGSGRDIGVKSTAFGNRKKLVGEMEALANGYRATNHRVPDEPELFKRALRTAFGDKLESVTRKQLAGSVQKRSGQIVGKPTRRKAAKLSPRQQAIAHVREKMEEKGILHEESPPDESLL